MQGGKGKKQMWIRSSDLLRIVCRRLDRSQFSGIFEYVRCDPEISRIDEEYEKRQNV